MRILQISLIGGGLCGQGCTTWQLTRSTLAEGKTLTDIEYAMVLDNVAMFRDSTFYVGGEPHLSGCPLASILYHWRRYHKRYCHRRQS